jgi:uncharacterized DUF497 family protein
MDQHHRIGGNDFTWDAGKAAANLRKHGVRFEDAATVSWIRCSCSPTRRATTKRAMP